MEEKGTAVVKKSLFRRTSAATIAITTAKVASTAKTVNFDMLQTRPQLRMTGVKKITELGKSHMDFIVVYLVLMSSKGGSSR